MYGHGNGHHRSGVRAGSRLGKTITPHGEVNFLQMVGITTAELERLQADPSVEAVATLIEELRVRDPLLVTDMVRK